MKPKLIAYNMISTVVCIVLAFIIGSIPLLLIWTTVLGILCILDLGAEASGLAQK